MTKHRIYIDSLEKLALVINCDKNIITVELSDELKKHKNLAEHILINKKTLKSYLNDEEYILTKDKELLEKITIELTDSYSTIQVASFNPNNDEIIPSRSLTNYELRTLNQSRLLPTPKSNKKYHEKQLKTIFSKSKTDLHTHYPALMTSEEILTIATNNWSRSYYCDSSILEKIGIKVEEYKPQKQEDLSKDEKKYYVKTDSSTDQIIDILTLSSEDKTILMNHLSIPQVEQITFEDMEVIYKRRDSFIKNPNLFADYLGAIAKGYNKQGIQHASITFSKIIDPEWLLIADNYLPLIEQEFGVTFTFLAGISRHADPLERQELINKTINMADHPYIEGFDILATETNSTYDFLADLEWAAEHININFDLKKTPFVIRVHAGETSYHPENVRVLFEFAKKHPDIQIRIGHGIYGVLDEETLKLGSELNNVIIEMNPDSNYALNMLDMYHDYPLENYIKNKFPVVFGTDGYGLYQSTYQQIYKNINYFSENPELIISNIEKTEQKYIVDTLNGRKEREQLFVNKMKNSSHVLSEENKYVNFQQFNINSLKDLKQYKTKCPDDYEKIFKNAFTVKPTLTEEKKKLIKEMKDQKQESRKKELEIKLNSHQIKLISNTLNEKELINKVPIMITGAAKNENDFNTAKVLIEHILKFADPNKIYFISDGTDFGLNKLVHKLIKKHNQNHQKSQFKLVGILSEDIDADDLSKYLTHATTSEYKAWYQLPKCLIKNYKEMIYIAIGSDMLIRDTIQTIYNEAKDKNLNNLYLLEGAKGNLSSKDINFVLDNLYNQHAHLFKEIHNNDIQKSACQEVKKDLNVIDQGIFFRRKTGTITKIFCKHARNSGIELEPEFIHEFKKWSKMPVFNDKFYITLSSVLLDKKYDTRNLITFCKENHLIKNETQFLLKIDQDNLEFGEIKKFRIKEQ